MIDKADITFIKNVLMPKFGIQAIRLGFDNSTKHYPDIWLVWDKPPLIVVTAEWARQSTEERHKRLTHEFIHLLGKEHDESIGYNTHPSRDTYSMRVYESLTSNPDKVEKYQEQFFNLHNKVIAKLVKLFPNAVVTGRVKTIASLRQKATGRPLSSITDVSGMRIIFLDLRSLYEGIQTIRSSFNIVKEKDYLSHPKLGYRSYHFIVVESGLPVEIQLMTRRMDEWSLIGHDVFYKGKGMPIKLEKYHQKIAKIYETKDTGVEVRKPGAPSRWKTLGLPTFSLNPEKGG